ncbi:hypothetical protein CPB83DRAFT_855715 [Crepidotus variabilis]|uniref:Uncharacterized protein n=1 Tax=Crepidotus variabilis TaxID=179855 RepID=A0A9P6JPB0_9AGAR|nr:hypothetical protein CPB83DRAFT_855715 [Crepidotus variabilis]
MPRMTRQTPLEIDISSLSLAIDSAPSSTMQVTIDKQASPPTTEYQDDDNNPEWEDEVDPDLSMIVNPPTPERDSTAFEVPSTPPRPAQQSVYQGSPRVHSKVASKIVQRATHKIITLSVTHTTTVSPRKKTVKKMVKAKTELTAKEALILQYQKEYPGKTVEAISFSNLKATHMSRMNAEMSSELEAVDADGYMPWIHHQFYLNRFDKQLELFWDRYNEGANGVFEVFKRKAWYFGSKPEARGRSFTNDLLALTGAFLREQDHMSVGFMELTVATIQKPVVIAHAQHVTILTGTVDYTMTTSEQLDIQDAQQAIKRISESIGQEKSADGLQNNPEFIELVQDVGINVAICEQKKTDIAPSLSACEPQVIGESSAMMVQFKRNQMPWCLTDGLEWIFGIVIQENSKQKSYRLKTLRIDPQQEDARAELYQIFMVLLYWVSAQGPEILTLFQSS